MAFCIAESKESALYEIARINIGKLTQLAAKYPCEIFLSKGGRRVNAKSIMGVMMLAAGMGSSVLLETSGEQAEEAFTALEALINDRFGEGE